MQNRGGIDRFSQRGTPDEATGKRPVEWIDTDKAQRRYAIFSNRNLVASVRASVNMRLRISMVLAFLIFLFRTTFGDILGRPPRLARVVNDVVIVGAFRAGVASAR